MKIPEGGGIQDDEASGSSVEGSSFQLEGSSRSKRRYMGWMHNKFQLVDPYAIARRIKQLRNSQEAAENNNKMTIEDEVERSDEAECQHNSQKSRAGRMKRLKVLIEI